MATAPSRGDAARPLRTQTLPLCGLLGCWWWQDVADEQRKTIIQDAEADITDGIDTLLDREAE
jgi:hypothetical protein